MSNGVAEQTSVMATSSTDLIMANTYVAYSETVSLATLKRSNSEEGGKFAAVMQTIAVENDKKEKTEKGDVSRNEERDDLVPTNPGKSTPSGKAVDLNLAPLPIAGEDLNTCINGNMVNGEDLSNFEIEVEGRKVGTPSQKFGWLDLDRLSSLNKESPPAEFCESADSNAQLNSNSADISGVLYGNHEEVDVCAVLEQNADSMDVQRSNGPDQSVHDIDAEIAQLELELSKDYEKHRNLTTDRTSAEDQQQTTECPTENAMMTGSDTDDRILDDFVEISKADLETDSFLAMEAVATGQNPFVADENEKLLKQEITDRSEIVEEKGSVENQQHIETDEGAGETLAENYTFGFQNKVENETFASADSNVNVCSDDATHPMDNTHSASEEMHVHFDDSLPEDTSQIQKEQAGNQVIPKQILQQEQLPTYFQELLETENPKKSSDPNTSANTESPSTLPLDNINSDVSHAVKEDELSVILGEKENPYSHEYKNHTIPDRTAWNDKLLSPERGITFNLMAQEKQTELVNPENISEDLLKSPITNRSNSNPSEESELDEESTPRSDLERITCKCKKRMYDETEEMAPKPVTCVFCHCPRGSTPTHESHEFSIFTNNSHNTTNIENKDFTQQGDENNFSEDTNKVNLPIEKGPEDSETAVELPAANICQANKVASDQLQVLVGAESDNLQPNRDEDKIINLFLDDVSKSPNLSPKTDDLHRNPESDFSPAAATKNVIYENLPQDTVSAEFPLPKGSDSPTGEPTAEQNVLLTPDEGDWQYPPILSPEIDTDVRKTTDRVVEVYDNAGFNDDLDVKDMAEKPFENKIQPINMYNQEEMPQENLYEEITDVQPHRDRIPLPADHIYENYIPEEPIYEEIPDRQQLKFHTGSPNYEEIPNRDWHPPEPLYDVPGVPRPVALVHPEEFHLSAPKPDKPVQDTMKPVAKVAPHHLEEELSIEIPEEPTSAEERAAQRKESCPGKKNEEICSICDVESSPGPVQGDSQEPVDVHTLAFFVDVNKLSPEVHNTQEEERERHQQSERDTGMAFFIDIGQKSEKTPENQKKMPGQDVDKKRVSPKKLDVKKKLSPALHTKPTLATDDKVKNHEADKDTSETCLEIGEPTDWSDSAARDKEIISPGSQSTSSQNSVIHLRVSSDILYI